MNTSLRTVLAAALLAAAGSAFAADTDLVPTNTPAAAGQQQPARAAGSRAAAADNFTIDSRQEVAYQCRLDKETVKLTAMYGIKDGEIIVAQVKLSDQISPGLFRLPDNLLNRFVSQGEDGTMWTTLPATPATLHNTDGGTLSFKRNGTNTIIVDKCKIDKAATAKLKTK